MKQCHHLKPKQLTSILHNSVSTCVIYLNYQTHLIFLIHLLKEHMKRAVLLYNFPKLFPIHHLPLILPFLFSLPRVCCSISPLNIPSALTSHIFHTLFFTSFLPFTYLSPLHWLCFWFLFLSLYLTHTHIPHASHHTQVIHMRENR